MAYETVATYVKMKMNAGDEQKPGMLKRAVKAAMRGTPWESKAKSSRQISKILMHVREDHPELERAGVCTVDDRRWLWTTFSNLKQWYDDWKAFLLEKGFATDEPQELPCGRTAEVTIRPQKMRTHHRLSNEGDRGGSRATTWVDKTFGRSGRRKVAATQGHVTGLYTALADGQNGPPFYFFQSDAENPESYKIDARWVLGLPRVRFQQPDGTIVVIPPGTIVTPKGGMNGESFEKWLDMCIYPLFPDIAPDWEYDEEGNVVAGPVVLKIDGGPGRLGPASHGWRTRAAARGLYTFPGLQNATSVNQEMDDLYGCFQQTCTDVTGTIVAERIAQRALEVGSLPSPSPHPAPACPHLPNSSADAR